MKKMDPLVNLNDCSKFSTLQHESDITDSHPNTLPKGKHGTINLSPAILQMESGTLHKIFRLPSKGAPEADQALDKTAVGQVINTKPLRPFFNITFYIKWIYRCIKINPT